MQVKFLKIVLLFCFSSALVYGQKKTAKSFDKKRGMFSFSANYSDYGFFKAVKDSSLNYAFNRKGLFKSGSSSFGIGVSYWMGLGSHFDFSGNLAGTFSNFPALYIKDDSIGMASFSPQLDLLLHAKAFKENRKINPFLTAGIGAGYFGKQLVVYAPVGVGLQFHFNNGVYLFLQAQWKMALTDGIKNDFMFYSLGFGQQNKSKKTEPKPKLPGIDTAKKVVKKDTVAMPPKVEIDSDGDGFPDITDLCVTEKGTASGCPDADDDGVADKDDQCKDAKGVAKYNGCPVPDRDGDGVNDEIDNCPDVKGEQDNNGCPTDTDGDGIVDKDDKCPDAAGTSENSGCPIKILDGGKLIRSSGDSMTYFIRFDFDKANITREAFAILGQMVPLLKADMSLMINIEGHADNIGIEKHNMAISQERAIVASDYLQSYGIAKSRMRIAFYGSTKPYDVHQDWLNRRVEITIYKKK